MKKRGGKREGAGRKSLGKTNKTFSLSQFIVEKKPTSALVEQLLKKHYEKNNN